MNPNIHTAEVLPPRAVLFVGIVALHVVFAWFLTSGLMAATIKILVPNKPLEFVPIDPPPKPQPLPIEGATIIDAVPIPIPDKPLVPDIEDTVVLDTVPEPIDPLPITQTERVPVAEPPIRLIGHNVLPNADNYYPPNKIRTNEEGSAVVRACVNENGKLMEGAPIVESSSGSADFDRAALRVARDGKYARSMRGDTPVPNCHRFRVSFSLH